MTLFSRNITIGFYFALVLAGVRIVSELNKPAYYSPSLISNTFILTDDCLGGENLCVAELVWSGQYVEHAQIGKKRLWNSKRKGLLLEKRQVTKDVCRWLTSEGWPYRWEVCSPQTVDEFAETWDSSTGVPEERHFRPMKVLNLQNVVAVPEGVSENKAVYVLYSDWVIKSLDGVNNFSLDYEKNRGGYYARKEYFEKALVAIRKYCGGDLKKC